MPVTGPRLRPRPRPRELGLLAIAAAALLLGSVSLGLTDRIVAGDPPLAGPGLPLADGTALAVYLLGLIPLAAALVGWAVWRARKQAP
jgi:hypothetical protein